MTGGLGGKKSVSYAREDGCNPSGPGKCPLSELGVKAGHQTKGGDQAQPYQMPKEDTARQLSLEEELDAKSVFDPLVPSSQSSQPLNSQSSVAPDTTLEVTGLKTPPHFSEAPVSVPPFNLSLIGILPQMSPVTERENTLLNLAPGSPVKNIDHPGQAEV